MKHNNLKYTPTLSDCVSFLYVDRSIIEQDEYGLVILKKGNKYHVPITSFACICFGPGTSVSHAAMKNIADAGTYAVWVRQNMEGMYVAGNGRTSSNKNLIMQAKCFSDKKTHTRNEFCLWTPDEYMASNVNYSEME